MAQKHLTAEEREEIARLHWQGVPKRQIAQRLGRDYTTITREFKRNSVLKPYSGRRAYCPIQAQRQCEARRHAPRKKKMDRPELAKYVQDGLQKRWSPDEISGRLPLEFPHDARMRISDQGIYNWIGSLDLPRKWLECLRRFSRKTHRPRPRPDAARIANRPEVIERRERVGDWEGDTIVGARHSGAIVTLVERKTGFAILAQVKNLQSKLVGRRIERRLRAVPPSQRLSTTFDNGVEFADYVRFGKNLHMTVYFADPYSPWQRGTNENTNGLVRQFLPKGTELRGVSPAAVNCIQNLLNNRPRKRHGYKTPAELLAEDASRAMVS